MRSSLENKTFTIFLEGELNSYYAANIEKEIEELLSKNSFDKLVLASYMFTVHIFNFPF